jgi:hypothetical protein
LLISLSTVLKTIAFAIEILKKLIGIFMNAQYVVSGNGTFIQSILLFNNNLTIIMEQQLSLIPTPGIRSRLKREIEKFINDNLCTKEGINITPIIENNRTTIQSYDIEIQNIKYNYITVFYSTSHNTTYTHACIHAHIHTQMLRPLMLPRHIRVRVKQLIIIHMPMQICDANY